MGTGALRQAIAQGYNDTPFLPGGKWRVHDSKRPQPAVITPPSGLTAPSDAIVLFDGKDLSKWNGNWKVENGYMEVRGGSLTTKESFGDCQIHLEYQAPNPPKGSDQGRANSGLFLMSRYEFQVLDCYENKTYADGMPGGIYGQTPPLVNACRKPGEWNTYDIIFVAPRFSNGQVVSPAYATVILNGILTQHATPLIGSTTHRQVGKYEVHGEKEPIYLQDHGDPVRFRNIWIRPIGPFAEISPRLAPGLG